MFNVPEMPIEPPIEEERDTLLCDCCGEEILSGFVEWESDIICEDCFEIEFGAMIDNMTFSEKVDLVGAKFHDMW